jgi:hypothetical protein
LGGGGISWNGLDAFAKFKIAAKIIERSRPYWSQSDCTTRGGNLVETRFGEMRILEINKTFLEA